MNNHYKRMFVLSEEEYNRLKLQQRVEEPPKAVKEEPPVHEPIVHVAPIVHEVQNTTVIEEPKIVEAPSSSRYKCFVCTRSYKQKRDLRRHVKLVHGIAPPTQVAIPLSTKKEEKPKKKRSPKPKTFPVFDKVKKWMTMHD